MTVLQGSEVASLAASFRDRGPLRALAVAFCALAALALSGCYAAHELRTDVDAGQGLDAAPCPVLVRRERASLPPCVDIVPAFEAAAARLGCASVPPVCHYECTPETGAEAAFACATDCRELFEQDRHLCGP